MERFQSIRERLNLFKHRDELPRTATEYDIDAIPEDEEIVLFDWMEVLRRHNVVYQQAIDDDADRVRREIRTGYNDSVAHKEHPFLDP